MGRPRLADLPDDERARLSAGFVIKLRDLSLELLRAHTLAANDPSRQGRRQAKKASRVFMDDLLDALRSLGLSEVDAKALTLMAQQEAVAANPPISDLPTLEAVADSLWSVMIDALDERGYLSRDEAYNWIKSHSDAEETE
jgi:hypothetical protein